MNNLAKIAAYIESHGFRAEVLRTSVLFLIPYIAADGSKGFEENHAASMTDARRILGY